MSRNSEARITRKPPALAGPTSSVASDADRKPREYIVASTISMISDSRAG
jgi:hypothetical protein